MLHAEYHYGADFLAATLAHVGQVDSAIIFFILTPLAATAAYLAASELAANVLRSTRLGLLAGLFFSFGSGLPFLIAPARSIHLRWFTPTSTAAEEVLLDTFDSITPNAFAAYPHFLMQPHYLIAWGILLSCIIIANQLNARSQSNGNTVTQWYYWIPLGVLFASVALIESSVFVLGLDRVGSLRNLADGVTQRQTALSSAISSLPPHLPRCSPSFREASFLLYYSLLRKVTVVCARLSTCLSFFCPSNSVRQFNRSPTRRPGLRSISVIFGLPLLAAPALIYLGNPI